MIGVLFGSSQLPCGSGNPVGIAGWTRLRSSIVESEYRLSAKAEPSAYQSAKLRQIGLDAFASARL